MRCNIRIQKKTYYENYRTKEIKRKSQFDNMIIFSRETQEAKEYLNELIRNLKILNTTPNVELTKL